MLTRRARQALDAPVACVILGDGFSARVLALKLLLFNGIASLICDTEKSALGLLIPAGTYCGLCPTSEGELIQRQLEDMADGFGDGVRFLVLASEKFNTLLEGRREALESRYIIADKSSILSMSAPFGRYC